MQRKRLKFIKENKGRAFALAPFNFRRIMKKILIVDDEPNIRTLVAKYAKFENYEVIEAADGMKAVLLAKENAPDIIIMDIMMPELDGFSAVREIKKTMPRIPVIFLSARGEEYDRINGFETGADDYVVKPFSPKELMLRINAVLKRTNGGGDKSALKNDIFRAGSLEVDMSARIVKINGERINLSFKEYELLTYMIKNDGLALSREKLICDVWGYDFYGDDRTLDTHIKLLRKSLGTYGNKIVTLRGVGYRFESDKE